MTPLTSARRYGTAGSGDASSGGGGGGTPLSNAAAAAAKEAPSEPPYGATPELQSALAAFAAAQWGVQVKIMQRLKATAVNTASKPVVLPVLKQSIAVALNAAGTPLCSLNIFR